MRERKVPSATTSMLAFVTGWIVVQFIEVENIVR